MAEDDDLKKQGSFTAEPFAKDENQIDQDFGKPIHTEGEATPMRRRELGEVDDDFMIGIHNETKESQNQTQTIQDATKILFDKIGNEELASLAAKQKTL